MTTVPNPDHVEKNIPFNIAFGINSEMKILKYLLVV